MRQDLEDALTRELLRTPSGEVNIFPILGAGTYGRTSFRQAIDPKTERWIDEVMPEDVEYAEARRFPTTTTGILALADNWEKRVREIKEEVDEELARGSTHEDIMRAGNQAYFDDELNMAKELKRTALRLAPLERRFGY